MCNFPSKRILPAALSLQRSRRKAVRPPTLLVYQKERGAHRKTKVWWWANLNTAWFSSVEQRRSPVQSFNHIPLWFAPILRFKCILVMVASFRECFKTFSMPSVLSLLSLPLVYPLPPANFVVLLLFLSSASQWVCPPTYSLSDFSVTLQWFMSWNRQVWHLGLLLPP